MGNISNIIGDKTESFFAEWLNKMGLPFFYVGQKQTIPSATLLHILNAKRPDFIILIPRIGMFLVDVKGISLFRIKQSFDIKQIDFNNYFNLEKHFNFKLFLVFYDIKFDPENFYWISMSKINIVKIDGQIKNKNGSFHRVYRIPLLECSKISVNQNPQSFLDKFQDIK